MAISDTLHEAEADLAELVGLPGAIRDKVKAGVAELRHIHDAIEAELGRLTAGAKATLDSLRALQPEPTEPAPAKPEDDAPLRPPASEDDRPPLTF